MELRESLVLYKRRWKLSAVLFVIVIGGAFAWSYLRPQYYTTSISFAVNGTTAVQTSDYQYGGYYALQAADLFSQTVVSWFQTPSVLVSIYDRAGIPSHVDTLQNLTARFKTKKYSAQNIVVTYASPTESEAQKVATALAAEISSRTSSLNQVAQDKPQFEVVSGNPVTVLAKPNPSLIAIASFIIALTLLVFLVPLVEYLSVKPRSE
jgi:hypothetical protein